MFLLMGEDFKNRLKAFIDDELPYHFHESIQLHDNLPTLTTDANVAKHSSKDTLKIQNGFGIKLPFRAGLHCAYKISKFFTLVLRGCLHHTKRSLRA